MDRKKIGRYEIIDELGRGAMGAVLRARDPAMGRTVALKCILSGALAGDQTNEFRERFFREARAAGALAHPGIVPVFDAGEDGDVPFLVMELVQGRTLADALKQGERFSLERVCEIGQGIAEALGYAHRNGIVHRDIKPANILMTSKEVYGAERPRITDFGVAKLAGGEITTTGQLLGTPAFMPPEQFTGTPIDGRADLFSLGVILYRMATGEQPFSGETITAVSYKIVHTDPIPPSRLNPAVGQRLEAVLLRCLAKSPSDRYQTGEELARDLEAVRTGAQVPAPVFAPLGQGTLAGFDPGQTLDVTAGVMPKTYAGPAPQWTMGPPSPPSMPSVPPGQWPAPPPQSWNAPSSGPMAQPTMPQPQRPMPPSQPMSAPPPPAPMRTVSTPAPMSTVSVPSPRPGPAGESRAMRTATARAAAARDEAHPTMRTGKMAREERPKKKGTTILIWVILLVVAVVVTRYLLQSRVQQALQRAGESGQAAGAPPEPIAGSAPAPTQTNFNPRNLDPARSGHLRLALDSFPSAIVLTVQVDGGQFWSGQAGQSSGSDLVVPSGKHDVRVAVFAPGGTAPILSNSAAGDFSARKRMLLNAQVHPEPPPGAATLTPGSRITLTVKPDPLSM